MQNKGFDLSLILVLSISIVLFLVLFVLPMVELFKFDKQLFLKSLGSSLGFLLLIGGTWLILPSSIRRLVSTLLGSLHGVERRLFHGRDIFFLLNPYRLGFSNISWIFKPYSLKIKLFGLSLNSLGLLILIYLYSSDDIIALI